MSSFTKKQQLISQDEPERGSVSVKIHQDNHVNKACMARKPPDQCESTQLHFEVVFILMLSSFWGHLYLYFEIIFILRSSSFWGCLHSEGCFYFEVAFNFRSYSFWGHLHFDVVFILIFSSFWSCLHWEVVFIWRISSRVGEGFRTFPIWKNTQCLANMA